MDCVTEPFDKIDVLGFCGVEWRVRDGLTRTLLKELRVDRGSTLDQIWSDDLPDLPEDLVGNLFRVVKAKERQIYST